MINNTLQSSVATCFSFGGTFDQYFITNLLLSVF